MWQELKRVAERPHKQTINVMGEISMLESDKWAVRMGILEASEATRSALTDLLENSAQQPQVQKVVLLANVDQQNVIVSLRRLNDDKERARSPKQRD